MVDGLLVTRHGSGLTGKVLAALGALFVAAAAYMMLASAVTHRIDDPGGNDSGAISVPMLQRLSPGELADKEQTLRAAYARDPLDASAVLDLSRIAEATGNTEVSERLRLSAGDMMPRASKVQAEALAILLKRRDFDQVMAHLDGLIRAEPSQSPNFFALAAEISGDDEGSRAVARALASNPPWRPQLMSYLISSGRPETAKRIMGDLQAIGAPPDDGEIRSLIDSYLKAGDVDRAYAVWLSNLSEDEMKDVKRIYNGGFAHPLRNLRFDWTLKQADGFVYRLVPRNTASMDQVLQLDFSDFGGTFANLSQILRLNPGRYRLSGETRFEDFTSPTNLVFRLYCLEGGKVKLLDETPPLPQSTQMIGFEKTFQVPDQDCPDQVLQLESEARLQKIQFTHGLVALDGMLIDSLPPLAP